jgi:putative redox protein
LAFHSNVEGFFFKFITFAKKNYKMETARTIYLGALRTEALHVRSGVKITTDAPIDNQGKGEFFSPTDLVAAVLASCMLTIIGIAARTHGFNIDGTEAVVTKVMLSNPRRIGEVIIGFNFPDIVYTEKQKDIIELAARTCPVALSLHPDLKQSITFNFKG